MSRMLKYLNQRCTLQSVKIDSNGEPEMDGYGDLAYDAIKLIPCRREKYVRDVETATGAVLKSSTEYYTISSIGINDKLDGKVVLSVEEYTNSIGGTEGYVSIT